MTADAMQRLFLNMETLVKEYRESANAELRDLGLRSAEILCLQTLMYHPDGLSVIELAGASERDKAQISRTMKSLNSRGYVQENPADAARQRKVRWQLSDLGQKVTWSMLAKKFFPETLDKISNELTPMVATARIIKKEHPDAGVVFIGPCASKKLEASRRSVRSDVDFVITFEELTGMFEARGILLDEIQAMDEMRDATAAGRGYGVAGGVASAIEACVREYYPDVDVHIEHAESLSECKKILMLAKAGKKNGCLIEGMACPGGCIAGAGTNIALNQAAKELQKFKEEAAKKVPDMPTE